MAIPTAPTKPLLHRPTVGIVALVLLVVGGATMIFGPPSIWTDQLISACMRIGGVLAVVWLALPDLRQARHRWFLVGLAGICIAILVVPRGMKLTKLIPLGAVLIAALMVLRPRRR